MSKTSPYEQKWAKQGGEALKKLYLERKKRLNLSLEKMGNKLGYKGKGKITSVKSILDGRTKMTPEMILALAEELEKYAPADVALKVLPEANFEIESIISTHAGSQMPSLLMLEKTEREEVLNSIAKMSQLALISAQYTNDSDYLVRLARSLAFREIAQVLNGWLEISELLLVLSQMNEESTNTDNAWIERYKILWGLWNRIETQINKHNLPIQTSYANLLWAQIQAWSGETQVADLKAEKALEVLNSVQVNEDTEVRSLKYFAYIIGGDNKRVKGQIKTALNYYQKARETIPNNDHAISLANRVLLKEFNTFLLAHIFPPNELIEQVRFLSKDSKDPSTKARALFAIAWLERSQHGDGIVSSLNYGEEALQNAELSKNQRIRANGHQYLGDAYLLLGEFAKARQHLEESLLLISPSRLGRFGYSKLLLGHLHAYLGIREFEKGNFKGWKEEIQITDTYFQEAEANFREASSYYKSGSGAYQLKRLLIEDAKWKSVATVIAITVDEQSKTDSFDKFAAGLKAARMKLDEARSLLWFTTKDVYVETIATYKLMIDYFEWIMVHNQDIPTGAKLEQEINEYLSGLANPYSSVGNVLNEFAYFEKEYFNCRARLHAIRGVLRWKMALDGKSASDDDFHKSAMIASQYDFLSILDCRTLICLALGVETMRLVYDTRLKIKYRESIAKYLASAHRVKLPQKL